MEQLQHMRKHCVSVPNAGKKDAISKAWEEGKIMIPDDGHPGQLSSGAVDHKAWMRAETNTYEIDYEEVSGAVKHCARFASLSILSALVLKHIAFCLAMTPAPAHQRLPVNRAACKMVQQTLHSMKKSPNETVPTGSTSCRAVMQ